MKLIDRLVGSGWGSLQIALLKTICANYHFVQELAAMTLFQYSLHCFHLRTMLENFLSAHTNSHEAINLHKHA